jgi:D-aminopeptidase
MAWNAVSQYGARKYGGFVYKLPVVAETYDGEMSDIDSYPLTAEDVIEALESAASGPVEEGNVGGGTGMTCYEFKGGIGTASRLVDAGEAHYSVGALVQANHGLRHQLTVNGLAVGKILDMQQVPPPGDQKEGSSILAVIATDAPLIPDQCRRLARRATIGLARTGGVAYNTSGDLFLAFATGNHQQVGADGLVDLKMLPQRRMDPLIEATADAVEESILNALTAAETMTGYRDRVAYELPLDALARLLVK